MDIVVRYRWSQTKVTALSLTAPSSLCNSCPRASCIRTSCRSLAYGRRRRSDRAPGRIWTRSSRRAWTSRDLSCRATRHLMPSSALPMKDDPGRRSGTTKRGWGPGTDSRSRRVESSRAGSARREDFSREARRRVEREEPRSHQDLQPSPRFPPKDIAERYLDELAPRIAPMIGDNRGARARRLGARRAHPLRGGASDVPRP